MTGIDIEYLIFPLVSFLAALVSSMIGFGGGILMMILLSIFVPIKELIAVVGLVQLGSLLSRMYVHRHDADYRLAGKYLIGAIPGTLIAVVLFDQIDGASLALILASFLLFSAWSPTGVPVGRSVLGLTTAGAFTSFFAFFVGAPGPIVASIMRSFQLVKRRFLGTLAACFLGLNLMKLTAFYSIGFPVERWWWICLLMMATGVLGTLAGNRLMGMVDDVLVYKVVRVAMALAAVNLILKYV